MEQVKKVIETMCQKLLEEHENEVKAQLAKAIEAYVLKAAQDFHQELLGYAQSIIDPSEDRSEETLDAKEQDNVDVEGRDN